MNVSNYFLRSLLLLASTTSSCNECHGLIMHRIKKSTFVCLKPGNFNKCLQVPVLWEQWFICCSPFTFLISLTILQSFISSPLSQVFASWRVLSDSVPAPAELVHPWARLPRRLRSFCSILPLMSGWSHAGHGGSRTTAQRCFRAACSSFPTIVFAIILAPRWFFSENYPHCLQYVFLRDNI